MPTEKRARKRAARDAKMAVLEKQRRRQATVRRTITIVVIAGVAVGIYFAVSSGSSKKTTTSSKKTTTTLASGDTQAALNAVAVRAGCPTSPTQPLTKPTWPAPPAMTINTADTYTANVKTDIGSFTIGLDAKDAPQTVNSFVFLADHDFFNCQAFMRVIPGFMNQTGSPSQSNGGSNSGPGYTIPNENSHPPNGYVSGDVAMANTGQPNSGGSQFFVLAGAYNPFTSDPSSIGYSLFGTVTSGESVVQKINQDGNSNSASNGVPPKIIHRMLTVTISTTPGT